MTFHHLGKSSPPKEIHGLGVLENIRSSIKLRDLNIATKSSFANADTGAFKSLSNQTKSLLIRDYFPSPTRQITNVSPVKVKLCLKFTVYAKLSFYEKSSEFCANK